MCALKYQSTIPSKAWNRCEAPFSSSGKAHLQHSVYVPHLSDTELINPFAKHLITVSPGRDTATVLFLKLINFKLINAVL